MAQEGVISTENATIAKVKDGDKVKPFDTVIVYATKKAGFLKAGDKWKVHPMLAAKLIDSGKATKEAPKGGKTPLIEEEPEGDPIDETSK